MRLVSRGMGVLVALAAVAPAAGDDSLSARPRRGRCSCSCPSRLAHASLAAVVLALVALQSLRANASS